MSRVSVHCKLVTRATHFVAYPRQRCAGVKSNLTSMNETETQGMSESITDMQEMKKCKAEILTPLFQPAPWLGCGCVLCVLVPVFQLFQHTGGALRFSFAEVVCFSGVLIQTIEFDLLIFKCARLRAGMLHHQFPRS